MNVNDAKHQARLAEWKTVIAECRSSGQTVKQWCAANGRNTSTYYRWEREIFGNIRKDTGKKVEALAPVELSAVKQPIMAELPVSEPKPVSSDTCHETERFQAAAVVRVGKLEVELSNAVSPKLMRQLKELVSNA